MSNDAKQCPWCERWCLKDSNCNYIFACGLDEKGKFHIGKGCGKSWCFECGKKYCGIYFDADTGKKSLQAKDMHDMNCCFDESQEKTQKEYCEGGRSSHCKKRW